MNEKQIIDFFKNRKENLTEQNLSLGHTERFMSKLKNSENKRKTYPIVYKCAAVVTLLISLSLSINIFNQKNYVTEEDTQLKKTEFFFSNTINYELKKINALKNPTNEKLIDAAEHQLELLEIEYQKIWEKYQLNYKNEIISNAIIENLEQRIEILKNLNEQLNILKINTDGNTKNI